MLAIGRVGKCLRVAKGTSTGALRILLVALDDRARLDRVRRVPQLLLQHSLVLRKRAVGLTYAYWLTSVEHFPL